MNLQTCIILYSLLFSLKPNQAKTNYFEGKVYYKFEFHAKNANVDPAMLKQFIGDGTVLIFKDGNYKHIFNGGLSKEDFYRRKDNKFYYKKIDNDSIFWVDCGQAGDKILKISITGKKESVLGITCNEIIIYYKDKTETQYYNSSLLPTDPEWFKNFKMDGEYLIDKKIKSIYLKHKIEYSDFTIIETATKYSRESVDESIYNISPDAILVEQK